MAIPTYTYNIKSELIKNYLGANLVVCLINNSALGITDTPSATELEARKNFLATDIPTYEIGGTTLNGYARFIVLNSSITPVAVTGDRTEAPISASFTASGGDMDAFSHIVVLRGANLTGADPGLNGNNRGDTTGTIVLVEPVDNLASPGNPLVITDTTTFNYNFTLISSSETV